MALEVEHKFLVRDDGWRNAADDGHFMRQGYLANVGVTSVRVRISGDDARLNIKHARSLTVRLEYEYSIPLEDARELLDACGGPSVEKTRYRVPHAGHLWEVDVFAGDNEGLVMAEVELAGEGEHFERPPWLGEEVSQDPRYLNQNLAVRPFKHWAAE